MLRSSPEILTRLQAPDPRALAMPASYDAKARTIEAIVATDAAIKRYGVAEALVMSAASADLTRAAEGRMAFLFNHDPDRPIGTVVRASIKSGNLVALLRFADTPEGRKAEGQVARGELSQFSIGFGVSAWAPTKTASANDTVRAVSWELFEVSLVSIPADKAAVVRSLSKGKSMDPEDDVDTLTPPAPAAQNPPSAAARAAERTERTRVATISDIGRRAGFDQIRIDQAIETGETVESVRAAAFDNLVARQRPASHIRVERDEVDGRISDMSAELMRRMSGEQAPRNDTSRRYFELSLVEMAAEAIGHRGRIPFNEAGREEILKRAFHATSDFPNMLENAKNGQLAARYQAAQTTYRAMCMRRDLPDFRPAPLYRAGDFPALEPVNPEAGEIKFGTFSDGGREVMTVASFAVGMGFSRKLLVNDNWRAIDDVLNSYATTVAAQEERIFWSLVLSAAGAGPTLLTTTRPIFNVTDGSLATTPAAITEASLSVGRSSMRKHKSIDGLFVQSEPKFLVVGPDKETEADKILAAITPQSSGNVNPFAGKLEKVVTPEIPGNAWFLFADPERVPAFVYSLLEGFLAPRLSFHTPFTTQGMQAKVEHDVGFTAIDFRGAYRNAGA
jgi:HK97 family phage prohead protease